MTTKVGREFVHNLETMESFWSGKAPGEVQNAVEKLKEIPVGERKMLEEEERVASRRRRRDRREQSLRKDNAKGKEVEGSSERKEEGEGGAGEEEGAPRGRKRSASALGDEGEEEEDEEEYEEYEEEDEEDEEAPEGHPPPPTGPVEFTEDDVAYQLEALAAEYGLEEEDMIEGEDLPEESAVQIFTEMLAELNPNPYGTFEAAIPTIVDDARYTVLPTTHHRKDVFTAWCRDRIAQLKLEKEKAKKLDPRVSYLEFLREKLEGQKKELYWPEFKRKWKKEKDMKDVKVTDKDREKMYREFVAHGKLSPAMLENDLKKLLKSSTSLTRYTDLDDLPTSILIDVRYAGYPATPSTSAPPPRDSVIKEYLSTLPSHPQSPNTLKARSTEQALREREERVRREKGRVRGEIERGREMVKAEEREVKRAVREVGRRGLFNQLREEMGEKEKEKKEGEGAKDGAGKERESS